MGSEKAALASTVAAEGVHRVVFGIWTRKGAHRETQLELLVSAVAAAAVVVD